MGWWFGRILTFETFADEEPASIAAILDDATGGRIVCEDARQLGGYAAYGDSIRAAIQPIVDCYAVHLFDDGLRLQSPHVEQPIRIDNDSFGNSSDGEGAGRLQREQAAARMLPSALRLGYYDPALDYQSGEARASATERRGTEMRQELPAAVTASDAKTLVQSMIAREWASRDKLTLRLPPSYIGLLPGTNLDLDLSPRRWIVEKCTIEGFVVVAELRPEAGSSSPLLADGGRIAANADVEIADITLSLFDVPDILGQVGGVPTILLAASSPTMAWKTYAVEFVASGQTIEAQTARRKSVLGLSLSSLGLGDPYVINQGATIDIQLIDPDQWLVSCDDDSLVAGANLAIIGNEVIQFGDAEALGSGRFRLGRLVRGRGGTEWAMDAHAPNEVFLLVRPDSVQTVPVPSSLIGTTVAAEAHNLSGATSKSQPIAISGESLRPLSPVALRAATDANGDLELSWTRRSRQGFSWIGRNRCAARRKDRAVSHHCERIGGYPGIRGQCAKFDDLGWTACQCRIRAGQH